MTMNQLRILVNHHGYDLYWPCSSPDHLSDDWIGIARSGEARFCLTVERPTDLFTVRDMVYLLPKIES